VEIAGACRKASAGFAARSRTARPRESEKEGRFMQSLTLHTAPGRPADPGRHPGRHESDPAERPELQPLLLSAADLAQQLRVSIATIWRLRAADKLPRPTAALGRQIIRWNADEIRRWVKAGMPDLKTWEMIDRQ